MDEHEKLQLCHRLSLWVNYLWHTVNSSAETVRTCSLQAMDFVRAISGGEVKANYSNRSRIIVMMRKHPYPCDPHLLDALKEFRT